MEHTNARLCTLSQDQPESPIPEFCIDYRIHYHHNVDGGGGSFPLDTTQTFSPPRCHPLIWSRSRLALAYFRTLVIFPSQKLLSKAVSTG